MTIEFDKACDEMRALFFADWSADTAAIVGYVPDVRWNKNQKPAIPANDKFWLRFSILAATESQSTLSNCEGAPGKKAYTALGLVYMQLFCPKSDLSADDKGRKLSIVARNAFRGKRTPGAVWFRNVRIIDANDEELFYRFNIVAEYEYDDFG